MGVLNTLMLSLVTRNKHVNRLLYMKGVSLQESQITHCVGSKAYG